VLLCCAESCAIFRLMALIAVWVPSSSLPRGSKEGRKDPICLCSSNRNCSFLHQSICCKSWDSCRFEVWIPAWISSWQKKKKKREEEWWECGKEGVFARGVFCCSLGFVVFLSPDEETLKKKKMKRNQVKTGGQTMLAERMASTKKIAATNYSCWYGERERERERFKNSHHENQSPNSTLFFHFFFQFSMASEIWSILVAWLA